jgi:uncharacterized protein VirK/YbjX
MRGATHTRRTNIGRQVKLAWGLLTTKPYRKQFGVVLNRNAHWKPVFSGQARSFEPLVQSFMDRRFGVAQRFSNLQHDLTFASHAFGLRTSARVALGERVMLWDVVGAGAVTLGLNEFCRREGLWTICLCTPEGIRLCQLSFSFTPDGRLMIGSVQGAPTSDERAMQGIRDLTGAAAGLRPPFLLVEVLRALCRRWGLDLSGIDPQHHVKKRWHQDELKVTFDYRAFWSELGGSMHVDETWNLPTQRNQRDLADIPPKRRAMYKRRTALLEALPGQLLNVAQ